MSEIDLSSPLNYGTPSSLGSIRTPKSGIRGTPIRMRPDVRSDKRIRQVNVASDPVSISNHLLYIIFCYVVSARRMLNLANGDINNMYDKNKVIPIPITCFKDTLLHT